MSSDKIFNLLAVALFIVVFSTSSLAEVNDAPMMNATYPNQELTVAVSDSTECECCVCDFEQECDRAYSGQTGGTVCDTYLKQCYLVGDACEGSDPVE